MSLKVGSLFSGIGGIELGFERAGGFETLWFVERDKYCQAVLRKHWPNTTIYDDITTTDFTTVPRVDVLTGGFPCQDISNAGKRIGITGSRSSLWKHYARAISEVRPKYAVIENVAALAKRGLDVVLADLAEIGYDAEWHSISASSVGALHRRERIFIIAHPESKRAGSNIGELRGLSNRSGEGVQKLAYANDCGHVYGQSEIISAERRLDALSQSEPSSSNVADATSELCEWAKPVGNKKSEPEWERRQHWACEACENASDSDLSGLQGGQEARNAGGSWTQRNEQPASQRGFWAVEPDFCGMVDGLSDFLDKVGGYECRKKKSSRSNAKPVE